MSVFKSSHSRRSSKRGTAAKICRVGLAVLLSFQMLFATVIPVMATDDDSTISDESAIESTYEVEDSSNNDSDNDSAVTVRDPWDWNAQSGGLTLESGSMTIAAEAPEGWSAPTASALAALVDNEGSGQAITDEIKLIADLVAALPELLPSEIPYTASISFSIDPDEVLDGCYMLEGDWFTISMPDGFEFAGELAEGGTISAYLVDQSGNPTDQIGAYLSIDRDTGLIRVELAAAAGVVSVDDSDDSDDSESSGDDLAASIEASSLSEIVVSASFDVVLGQDSVLSGSENHITWTLQDNGVSTVQSEIVVPSARTILEGWNIDVDQLVSDALAILNGSSSDESEGIESQDSEDERELTTETTTQAGAFNITTTPITTYWLDNNISTRPSTDDLVGGYRLYFTIEGDDGGPYVLYDAYGNLTSDAMEKLGLTEDQAPGSVTLTQTEVGTYVAKSPTLPSTVTQTVTVSYVDTGEVLEQTSTTLAVTWTMADENSASVYEGYSLGERSTDYVKYRMYLTDVVFTIIIKNGAEEVTDELISSLLSDMTMQYYFENAMDSQSKISDLIAGNYIEYSVESDSTITINASLPMYGYNAELLRYALSYNGEQGGSDYYQPVYDNSTAGGYGNETEIAHNGGTLTLIHQGTTTYSATKQWLDQDSSLRPEVTFTLWRYSSNDGSASTASHVMVSGEWVQFSIPAGSEADTVDLGKLLSEALNEIVDGYELSKYDSDGYAYIYCLREESYSAGDGIQYSYEVLYGEIGSDGAVTDTSPNWLDSNGDPVYVSDYSRADNDKFIYNGGTISNRISEDITVTQVKQWVIASFQAQMKDIECVFQAQYRYAGSDDEWADVEGGSGTVSIGFTLEESLTQQISGTFPRYDSFGHELEYRWIEVDVLQGGQSTGFTFIDNEIHATFTLEFLDGNDQEISMEFESIVNEDGSISNVFINYTEEYVEKWWQLSDTDEPTQYLFGSEYEGTEVEVQLFRNGILIGNYTMDGYVDEQSTQIEFVEDNITAFVTETEPYRLEFTNLPEYSPTGGKYDYIVLEVGMDGWYTERSYDSETCTTTITNTLGEGESSEIRIIKSWIDDSDLGHRLPVVVELYARHDMSSQDESVSYSKGDLVSSLTLTADQKWYGEVKIGIDKLDIDDFDIVERGLADEDIIYEAMTEEEALADPANSEWALVGWENDLERVATSEHVYEVSYGENADMNAFEIENRRLGSVNLEIDKTWVDAGVDPDDRPASNIAVFCIEYPNAFSVDADGYAYTTLEGGNTLPVLDADGNHLTGTIADDGALLIPIDKTLDESTYYVYGLPKCDGTGAFVHYSVEERWDGDHGDYTISTEVGDYVVGNRRYWDFQDFSLTNTRTGTREVVFYKEWKDAYVYEVLNQRPDIYLTLYMVSNDTGGELEEVEGYVHYLWSGTGFGDDPNYNQQCTIYNLPKYDSTGAEIVYYAVEEMASNGEDLDYVDVQFAYDNIPDSVDESDYTAVVDQSVTWFSIFAAERYALREDGTFVSSIEGSLVADGLKLWLNSPSGFEQEDLPEIAVYLQRKLANEEYWPTATIVSNEDLPADEIVSNAIDGYTVTDVIAWTSTLTKAGNNQYSFEITHTGDNSGDASDDGIELHEDIELLQKYDENGNLYQYTTIEIIWGLFDQPGGYTVEDLLDVNINISDPEGYFGDVYTVAHLQTGTFHITNTYNSAKGNLTVKKIFEGRSEGDLYPDITFTLYRSYITGTGEESSLQTIDTISVSGDEFLAEDNGNGNTEYTFTFEDLDIYAPDGSYWHYYVVESTTNDYTSTVSIGKVDSDGTFNEIKSDNAIETESGVQSPALVDEAGTSLVADDENVDVTFTNTYVPGKISMNVSKSWEDYGDLFNIRPNSITIVLTRTYAGGTEIVVLQSDDSDGDNYLTLDKTTHENTWRYTISNLEEWAPNGTKWVYTVSEQLDENSGYVDVNGDVSQTASEGGSFWLLNELAGQANVVKTWTNDADNMWGLRPTTVEVELLARVVCSSDDEDQEWANAHEVLAKYFDEGMLTAAGLGYDDMFTTLSESNDWSNYWVKLPIKAATGDGDEVEFEYIIVEVNYGDTEVNTPIIASDENGVTVVYEETYPYSISQTWNVTKKDNGATEFWSRIANTLDSTELTVTKIWDDDSNSENIRPMGTEEGTWVAEFWLQCKLVSEPDSAWEYVVTYGSDEAEDTYDANIVKITFTGTGDAATATFTGLPSTDETGAAYEYRVVELLPFDYIVNDGELVGEYNERPLVVVKGTSATVVDSGEAQQSFVNSLIPNRFMLEKINDASPVEYLNGIELSVLSTDGSITYAVWERDESGTVTSTIWTEGTDDVTVGGEEMTGEDAGWIVGLAAGSYIIRETGTLPANHSRAADIPITIAEDGTITSTAEGAVSETTEGRCTIYTITMVDPVFRAHIELTKTLNAADGSGTSTLAGVKFDLYRVGTGEGGADELMAIGIETDENGFWTSVGSDIEFVGNTDGRRAVLGDGLQPGSYYLLETEVPYNSALPQGEDAKTYFDILQESDHATTISLDVDNEEFIATVTAVKLDSSSMTPIEDAMFKLEYRPEGSTDSDYTVVLYDGESGVATDANGVLTLSGLHKGDYRLTETSNVGYDMETAFSCTFTIKDEDNGKTFDLANASDRIEIDYVLTGGEILDGEGILNNRLYGTVTMSKLGGEGSIWAALDGVEFELQMLVTNDDPIDSRSGTREGSTDDSSTDDATSDDGTWVTVVDKLVTGHRYSSSVVGSMEHFETQKVETGMIEVRGLEWGTYRLVETSPADGFVGVEDGTRVATSEFTIDRDTPDMQVSFTDSYSVLNSPTHFEILKLSSEGETLSGATFEVEPVDGSTFSDQSTSPISITTANGTGIASLTGCLVVGGTYTVTETIAPYGYELIEESLTIYVEEDGTISIVGEAPDAYSAYGTSGYSFVAVDGRIDIALLKVSSADGSALTGATVTIDGPFVDGTTSRTIEIDDDSVIISGLLSGETYTLREDTAPLGYELIEGELSFTVNPNGTIYVDPDNPAPEGFSIGSDAISIVIEDDPVKAVLYKVSTDGGPLSDAVFTITPDSESTFADGSTNPIEVESGADGYAQIPDAYLVAGMIYTLVEIRAPEGYVSAGDISFTVLEDGTLELVFADTDTGDFADTDTGDFADTDTGDFTEDPDGEQADDQQFAAWTASEDEDGIAVVTVANEPKVVSLDLMKVDPEGRTLAGAVYKISGNFADDSSALELTSGEDGRASMDNLVVGRQYTVEEITAPEGYLVSDDRVVFSIATDGTAVILSETDTSYIEDGGVTLAVVDSPITSEPDGSSDSSETPKTGDANIFMGMAAALMAGTAGVIFLMIWLRRRSS